MSGVPDAHLLGHGAERALFAPASCRIYRLEPMLDAALAPAIELGDRARVRMLLRAGGLLAPTPEPIVPTAVPLRSISLAIAGSCNLSCTYCYADQGGFGSTTKAMSRDVAIAAIDRLIADVDVGGAVRIVFMGGEPLTQRTLLRVLTGHARERARAANIKTAFSITTNGTLLDASDAEFFDAHGFAVTISLDGVGAANDRLRPTRGGRPSYQQVIERAQHLLAREDRRIQVFARASVTPENLDLPDTLATLSGHGFDAVQFSPVLRAPSGRGEMNAGALKTMLAAMIACSDLVEARLEQGEYLPFANLSATIKRIHERARDAYPCAAGGSYVGVSASGVLHACHRFIDDEAARLGDVVAGLDAELQASWLAARHVGAQPDCAGCWAQHLCSGGCHYEALGRGRPACDFIRGWLDHCLNLYVRLTRAQPEHLARLLGAGRDPHE